MNVGMNFLGSKSLKRDCTGDTNKFVKWVDTTYTRNRNLWNGMYFRFTALQYKFMM